jgi:ubiquitin-protein ligase
MYEQASERWSPVQSVEKVLLSVISMLAGMSCFCPFFVPFPLIVPKRRDSAHHTTPSPAPPFPQPPLLLILLTLKHLALEPNLESGANIDCCKLYRDNYTVRGSDALRVSAAADYIYF